MNAKKCDRCGTLYESSTCVPDLTVSKYHHPYGEERVDLCPKCQKTLEEWLYKNIEFSKGNNEEISCVETKKISLLHDLDI